MTRSISGILTRQRRLLKAQERIDRMYALRAADIVTLAEEMPVRQIADILHVSRQRVEQILKVAK